MDFLTSCLVNGPLVFLNFLANAFFLFCMVCPLHGEKIKQPLKLLLWTFIYCTVTYMISVLINFCVTYAPLMLASYTVFVFSLSTHMTTSVWLNFFYYAQIVPARRATFIWIKKNIKSVIFFAWLVDKMFCSLDVCVVLADYIALLNYRSHALSYNITMHDDTIYLEIPSFQQDVIAILICFMRAKFIISLCIMVLSSGSTVVYLCKHMQRMVANGQPFSCPRFKSQLRVTTTGLLQGVLFVICAMFTVYKYFSQDILTGSQSGYSFTHFTVINVYMVGTTFSLGAGQSVFRQRAEDMWFRAVQWLKAPEVQQSKQEGR
uniref:taste receptor type 2 member 1-like n=1 Tax=Scatophagus argus TaxID=75038 RepID=UPI001ED85299|nr:taste receptor type 2 member 1-like [Scatophagus argus]